MHEEDVITLDEYLTHVIDRPGITTELFVDALEGIDTADITTGINSSNWRVEHGGITYTVLSFRVGESDQYPGHDSISIIVEVA